MIAWGMYTRSTGCCGGLHLLANILHHARLTGWSSHGSISACERRGGARLGDATPPESVLCQRPSLGGVLH